jgi:hypothetical protein
VFEELFGPYAGWAHNTLFISELASHKPLLPQQLQSAGGHGGVKGRKRAAVSGSTELTDGEGIDRDAGARDSSSQAGAVAVVIEEQVEVEAVGSSAVAGDGGEGAAAFVELSARGHRKRAAAAGVAAAVKAVKVQEDPSAEGWGTKRAKQWVQRVKREEQGS